MTVIWNQLLLEKAKGRERERARNEKDGFVGNVFFGSGYLAVLLLLPSHSWIGEGR